MRELTNTNLFRGDNICITTNGCIRKDGNAVMGRGVALAAAIHFDGVQRILAESLLEKGNHVAYLGKWGNKRIISFPTKNNWRDLSDINLIRRSCKELNQLVEELELEEVWLPRPGCTNGGLIYKQIRPVLLDLLSDKVVVVTDAYI